MKLKTDDLILYGALAIVAYLVYQLVNKPAAPPTGTATIGPLGPTDWTGLPGSTPATPFGVTDPSTW